MNVALPIPPRREMRTGGGGGMMRGMAKLAPKRERFVAEYLIDLNAAAAYRRAGYSVTNDHAASCGGARLLANVGIAQAIAAGQAELTKETKITAELVRRRLREEGDDRSEGSSHAARVAAWKALGQHINMFPKEVTHRGDAANPIPLKHEHNFTLAPDALGQFQRDCAAAGLDDAPRHHAGNGVAHSAPAER